MLANQPIRSHKKNSEKTPNKSEALKQEVLTVNSYISCSFPKPIEPVEQVHVHERPIEQQIILPENPIENVPTIALNELKPQNNGLIIQNKPTKNDDVLALVTSIIATKLNTPIDYKITKAKGEEKGEIYFKIGRFEFSRKVSK
jgi:hypothetical protein